MKTIEEKKKEKDLKDHSNPNDITINPSDDITAQPIRSYSMATSKQNYENFKKQTFSKTFVKNEEKIKKKEKKQKDKFFIESDINLSRPIRIKDLESQRKGLISERKIILEENEDYEKSINKDVIDKEVKRRLTMNNFCNLKKNSTESDINFKESDHKNIKSNPSASDVTILNNRPKLNIIEEEESNLVNYLNFRP